MRNIYNQVHCIAVHLVDSVFVTAVCLLIFSQGADILDGFGSSVHILLVRVQAEFQCKDLSVESSNSLLERFNFLGESLSEILEHLKSLFLSSSCDGE